MPKQQQLVRLKEAAITLTEKQQQKYIEAKDILPKDTTEVDIPQGYKRCGKCQQVKKYYLFNRNTGSPINCTGNCKDCQKKTAQKSYAKNKHKRNYKKYYAKNKARKREHNKKYYEENKERLAQQHKEYRKTPKGRKAIKKAHATRKRNLKENAGIPYTREMIIERDSTFINEKQPLCCLCSKPIEDLDDIHMEHLIPVVIGGKDCITNVGCAHSRCNLTKSKDAHEITTEQIETIKDRAEAYIDANPDKFPDFHEPEESD